MIFEKKILEAYTRKLVRRYDEDPAVFYYRPEDFEELQAEPYTFPGGNGQMLRGSFYYYGEKKTDRIVIFEHGMGAGHRAYMKEIEHIAWAGYTVLSYDKTGCADSEGESVRSFAQSVSDLDHCIRSLRSYATYRDSRIAVIGHSWGAYATLNIGALHPDITHLAALAGPISMKALLEQSFSGVLKGYLPALLAFERKFNPDYADLSAVDALGKTRAKALIVHSADDPMVKQSLHFDVLKKAHENRPGTRFLLVSGKKHNPHYTSGAVRYKDQFFADYTKKRKKKELETAEQKLAFRDSYDFHEMTQQDESLWQEIFAFLKD